MAHVSQASFPILSPNIVHRSQKVVVVQIHKNMYVVGIVHVRFGSQTVLSTECTRVKSQCVEMPTLVGPKFRLYRDLRIGLDRSGALRVSLASSILLNRSNFPVRRLQHSKPEKASFQRRPVSNPRSQTQTRCRNWLRTWVMI